MCGVFVKTYCNKTQWGGCEKNQLWNITDISHSVFHFGDRFTMSQRPCPSCPFLYECTLRTFALNRLVAVCFDGSFVFFCEGGFLKIVKYVSPEYSPSWKFQPTKELWIDFYYFEYCSFVLCVLRAPEGKSHAHVGWSHCILFGHFIFASRNLFRKNFDQCPG